MGDRRSLCNDLFRAVPRCELQSRARTTSQPLTYHYCTYHQAPSLLTVISPTLNEPKPSLHSADWFEAWSRTHATTAAPPRSFRCLYWRWEASAFGTGACASAVILESSHRPSAPSSPNLSCYRTSSQRCSAVCRWLNAWWHPMISWLWLGRTSWRCARCSNRLTAPRQGLLLGGATYCNRWPLARMSTVSCGRKCWRCWLAPLLMNGEIAKRCGYVCKDFARQ